MSTQIEPSDSSADSAVVSLGNGDMVTMKTVQSIYNEITGRTEKLSRRLKANHKVRFDDLKQLNVKINQLLDQYNVVSRKCSVTLFHVDDCKEELSSFEKLATFDQSSMSPVENVRFEYEFLIVLPETKKAQPYTIEVNIHSRSAIRSRAKKEHGLPRRIIGIFASSTGQIEIDYVDFTVARTFLVAIESWHESVECSKPNRVLEHLKDYSHHLPFLFKFFTIAVLGYCFYDASPKYLSGAENFLSLFRTTLVAIIGLWLASMVAAKFGVAAGRAIDSYQPLSGILLNRGDEKAFSDCEKAAEKIEIKLLLSIAATVALNVACAWLAFELGIGA